MSFTPFQRLIAQLTLEAIADLGFALGGGQALHALLTGDQWTPHSLFAALHDKLRPTITVDEFAADLAAAADQDPDDYGIYGLSPNDILRLGHDFTAWANQLRVGPH